MECLRVLIFFRSYVSRSQLPGNKRMIDSPLSEAVILLLFTLLPRSKMTLLPLDFEHFSPNIDNFAPIQKGHFAPYFYYYYFFLGWGGEVGT